MSSSISPASVSASPFTSLKISSSSPSTRSKSPRWLLPSKMKHFSSSRVKKLSSASLSSEISPTISSMISSSDTSPSVEPYSSTTIAIWILLDWKSASRSLIFLCSGTK